MKHRLDPRAFLQAITVLLLLASFCAVAQDVSLYAIVKQRRYEQLNDGVPTPRNPPDRFTASANTPPGGLLGGSLKLPGGSEQPLQVSGDGSGWADSADFASQSAMDAGFPNGTYQLTLNTAHDGTKVISLPLTGNAYPGAPQIQNFIAAQSVNPAAGFTVSWTGFTGGTINDYVQFTVAAPDGHEILSTGIYGKPGALDGTATSAGIPAGVLAAGQNYSVQVLFVRAVTVDSSSYGQGIKGVAAYSTKTRFNLTTTTAATGPEVTLVGVVKGQALSQTGPGAPVLKSGAPFVFNAFVNYDGPNTAAGASVQHLPGGTITPLTQESDASQYEGSFATRAALDTAFPNGDYRVTVDGGLAGVHDATLTVGGDNYPNDPQCSNFNAAQSVNPAGSFLLAWDAFAGGGPADFIQVQVRSFGEQGEDTVFRTPNNPGEPGGLDGTATSVTIPAGTLAAGTTYEVDLLFAKLIASNPPGFPGATGVAGYFKSTTFALKTSGGIITGPDVKFYGVAKAVRYQQTGTAAPVLETPAYRFNSFVDIAPGGLNSASLTLPGAGPTLPLSQEDEQSWKLQAEYMTKAALDAEYPNGTYFLALNATHDGVHNISLKLSGDRQPNVPQVLNFAATQAANPAAPFTVEWNPLTGGIISDFIQVTVGTESGETVFQTPEFGHPGALTGLSTSAIIPAGTLASGQGYQLDVTFAMLSYTDATSYGQGVVGVAANLTQTGLTLHTTGGAIAPTITIEPAGPSQWHLHANGAVGGNYLIENSDSLLQPINWKPMVNFTGSAAGFDFTDGVVHEQNYYRVRNAN